MTTRTQILSPTSLFGDFRLLLILFVGFRLLLLFAHEPILPDDGIERGVGVGGDRFYHYQLVQLTDEGDWPFVDWWSEFPPVFYIMTTGIYNLQGENVNYAAWSNALNIIMLLFEVGTLILARKIGTKIYGEVTGMALAWIYALMLAPVVFMFWNFEAMPAFFLLLGVWYLLCDSEIKSALVVGVGALVKFTPALIFGAVLRWRWAENALQRAALYIAVAVAVFAGAYALLYINNAANDGDPAMVTTSLTAQFGKASYQTVWALLDGNYGTGNFGTVASHLDADAADDPTGEPAVIPWFVRLALGGGVGLFVFLRPRRFDSRGLVAFVTITLLIFFLQAQGWSPQWMVQIIPLVLLCFPTRNGVLILVVLSFAVFAEYPILFNRTGDMGGEITGPLVGPFTALIIVRTFFLAAICVALYGVLRQEPIPEA